MQLRAVTRRQVVPAESKHFAGESLFRGLVHFTLQTVASAAS
jgi:hypothetical protein